MANVNQLFSWKCWFIFNAAPSIALLSLEAVKCKKFGIITSVYSVF